jgi:branched-chain amino acid transport system ATP-binding protein
VLLVEQKLNVCLGLAQRLYVLSKGDIKWTGTPGELEARQDIRKEYLEV